MPSGGATMTVAACARIVTAANGARSSAPVAAAPHPSGAPAWDALANSFAGLSAALTWGSIMLAAIALVTTEGIAILRQANQMTQPATSSDGGDVADAIAASAGDGDP